MLALGRLRQKDRKFKASLGYIANFRSALYIADPFSKTKKIRKIRQKKSPQGYK
jgi:hypothetical protein